VNHIRLDDVLRASAIAVPDRTAVEDRERSMSYAELDDRSNRLARLLVELGVGSGDRVGLFLEKSMESIVGIYGILKADAAYVPLDLQAPPARVAHCAHDCGIRVVVSSEKAAPSWKALVAHGAPVRQFVVLDTSADATRAHQPDEAGVIGRDGVDRCEGTRITGHDRSAELAYILYTSGSTGTPKGVMLSHRNGLAFVEWAVAEFSLGPADRISSHAPLHFDLSIFDVFAAALAGACLVLVPEKVGKFPVEVARLIERARISVWYSVPSILSMLVQRGNPSGHDLTHLRAVIFAGEVFHPRHLRRLMALLPQARFTNLYGPTETNVCTCYHVPERVEDVPDPIPIGKAIRGVDVFVVADDNQEAEPGQVGELYVRGPTVTSGYWGDPDGSAKSLVRWPIASTLPVVYRTGDLARQDDDGNFIFVGRRDLQVKTRGHRVELGDIEAALNADPLVAECAVVAVPDESISNRIIAFAVVTGDVDGRALLGECGRRIPHYMVPEAVVLRRSLPKTSTGKIDRSALRREAVDPDSRTSQHRQRETGACL
jgi:amino acid adenylation domain-containing protein